MTLVPFSQRGVRSDIYFSLAVFWDPHNNSRRSVPRCDARLGFLSSFAGEVTEIIRFSLKLFDRACDCAAAGFWTPQIGVHLVISRIEPPPVSVAVGVGVPLNFVFAVVCA